MESFDKGFLVVSSVFVDGSVNKSKSPEDEGKLAAAGAVVVTCKWKRCVLADILAT